MVVLAVTKERIGKLEKSEKDKSAVKEPGTDPRIQIFGCPTQKEKGGGGNGLNRGNSASVASRDSRLKLL